MARTPLYAVVALFAMVFLPSAGAVAGGEERVLVVLATAGPRPFSVADVQRTMRQADDFFRASSFGKVRLTVDVTPWLPAFSSNPGCGGTSNRSLEAIVAPARVAADAAGFDSKRYDDVVYTIADSHCGFFGATWGREVMLTRQPTLALLAHELGHAFGLGHAQATDFCATGPAACGVDDTGDPYSPMGSGELDFSAYEKVVLGWMPPQPHVTVAKQYVLAPATSGAAVPRALLVDSEDGSWWIEYRSRPFRGLLVRFVGTTRIDSQYAPSAILMMRPTKARRAWIARGESYRIPGSFRVTLLTAGAGRAQVRFR